MKLLVFAHTPPPHHGQSYMVKLMLDRFGGDARARADSFSEATNEGDGIECYHVNARYSDDLEDIGTFRFEKAWLVLRYCIEAIWCRMRYGVRAFYYVPAPGKRAALYRDWIVMLLCRPFFPQFIHHWHASGLGDWLQREGNWFERWLTHRLLGKPSLGLALAIPGMRDALWFETRRVELVPNGIPDPCPDFDSAVLPRRQARLAAREALLAGRPVDSATLAASGGDPECFRVLFLAHCMREKGLFDAMDGVALAAAELRASGSPIRIHLTVAGLFPTDADEAEFRARSSRQDLAGLLDYAGFAAGEEKSRLLATCDAMCFPSYYHAESFGLVIVEAMAAGMSVVTTRWRAIPDLLPGSYSGFVAPRSPGEIATALQSMFLAADSAALRAHFLEAFTEARHIETLAGALRTLEKAA